MSIPLVSHIFLAVALLLGVLELGISDLGVLVY